MASTRISDIIVPEIFNPYVVNRSMQLSALFQSGIVQSVPNLQLGVGKGNRLVNMPFFNDLSGDDEVLTDSGAMTPGKIGTSQDAATQLFRGRSWGVNDLAATMSGADPMRAIGDLVATYWTRKQQDALIAALKGVFLTGGTLNASHVNNISIETGLSATAANKISGGAAIGTISKLGDAHDALTGVIMHSVPYFELVRQELIVYEKNADGTVNIPTYLGKRVIVDDGMPAIPGTTNGFKYLTVFFGPGAVGYAEGQPEVPTETDRDSLAGEDYLITRKHYIIHPRGIKWTDNTVTGVSPSNTELALAANWSKVYEDKQIRMVALITNG